MIFLFNLLVCAPGFCLLTFLYIVSGNFFIVWKNFVSYAYQVRDIVRMFINFAIFLFKYKNTREKNCMYFIYSRHQFTILSRLSGAENIVKQSKNKQKLTAILKLSNRPFNWTTANANPTLYTMSASCLWRP